MDARSPLLLPNREKGDEYKADGLEYPRAAAGRASGLGFTPTYEAQGQQDRNGCKVPFQRRASNPSRRFTVILGGKYHVAGPNRQFLKKLSRATRLIAGLSLTALALSACATARMHSVEEINSVGARCGLALGELFQDEEEKKLLFVVRPETPPEQRVCVVRWARQNHLKTVFVDSIQFPES